MTEEVCTSFPVLGEPAPDFEAETTQGPIKLSDLKGKWVVLFSHPADFTPVFTTEFMAFAAIHDELAALNVNLSGFPLTAYRRILPGSGTSRRKWVSPSHSRSLPT